MIQKEYFGEDKNIEFKREIPAKREKFLKDIIAFSNCAGGKEATSYIRINGTSRPADARKLRELELEGQNVSYDSMQEIGKKYDEQKALHLCKEMIRMNSLQKRSERWWQMPLRIVVI